MHFIARNGVQAFLSLAAPLLRGPAQVGAFGLRSESMQLAPWIPAYAGMTPVTVVPSGLFSAYSS
jgi:hypothetical protein